MSNYDAEEITFQDIIDYGRRNSGNLPEETLNDEIHNKISLFIAQTCSRKPLTNPRLY